MLEELYIVVHKLEEHTILSILLNIIAKKTDTVETSEKARFRVHWIDEVVREIHRKKKHFPMIN